MIDTELQILKELRLIRLMTVAQAVKDMRQIEAIALLANAGVEPREIAESLGTTPGTVSVALVGLRKKGKVRKHGRD